MAPRRRYAKQNHEVGIYGIQNTITGKWYVGSSIELTKRMGRHLWELRTGRHHSQKLQRSFDKHGEAAFRFQILVVCAREHLDLFEERAIRVLRSATEGYNVADQPKGGFMRGRQWPAETKAQRVEAMKGFKHTDESKKKIKEALARRSAEDKRLQRERIGAANRKPLSEAGRKAIAAANRRRLQDPDPEQVEARRQNALKGHATRRANKLKETTHASASEAVLYGGK